MTTCPACQADTPAGARFCPSCGARLEANRPEATERKVVTTLFADLVGFTALGERHDPEDVDRALRDYYALVRAIIERFGGVVEKFIGDAVVGLFGVPAAHEDDAERAVRAALEIVARMRELPAIGDERLLVRAAVNTGPALVRLQVLPQSGEGVLVGDAVNTAARLLAQAPTMSVVVGSSTHRLTEREITYERMTAISAKGKARPVERWVARGAVSRRGVDAGRDDTQMVGREVELAVLSGLLDRMIASRSPQFALITGEAGIGKSRLLREFFRLVDARPGLLCTWRQGRCPPYGDGLAYGALSEIVSAHAGIQQGDASAVAETKLQACLPDGRMEQWLAGRLRPLMGLPAPATEREESFIAWTTFLEEVARKRATVIVVEDLHWASEPTLAFLGHFARQARGVPLLLVGTARPEFLEAHPDAHDLAPGLEHIDLKTLTGEESARLVSLHAHAAHQTNLVEDVAGRCGGNPLFAEELVRYLVERHAAGGPRSGSIEDDQAHVPTSVLALIAARLDALPPEQKALMADASVAGEVFWPAALRALRADPSSFVDDTLAHLEAREFIRRSSDTTIAGGQSFKFWHALVRDVAYSTMPRAVRAEKHQAVAAWIASQAERTEARALSHLLAHHYVTATELARAGGDDARVALLRVPARNALADAGRYDFPLDVAAAERCFTDAIELSTDEEPEYAELLAERARALTQRGELAPAARMLEDAIEQLRASGRTEKVVESMIELARCLYLLGDARHGDVALAALTLSEDGPRGQAWLTAKAHWCFLTAASFVGQPAVAAADDALRAYEELGEEPSPFVQGYRGMARCDLGDPGGLEDLQTAVRNSRRRGLVYEFAALTYDLADELHVYHGPRRALRVLKPAATLAVKRGDETSSSFLQAMLLFNQCYAGRWDAFLDGADALIPRLRRNRQAGDYVEVTVMSAYLRCMRGETVDTDAVRIACDAMLPAGPEEMMSYSIHLAWLFLAAGHSDTALELLLRAADTRDGFGCPLQTGMAMPRALDAAWRAGDRELAARFARGAPETRAIDKNVWLTHAARVFEADGDAERAAVGHAAAAAAWAAFDTPFEEAEALVAEARCLATLGRTTEAKATLAPARRILRRLKARPLLAEAEQLGARDGRG